MKPTEMKKVEEILQLIMLELDKTRKEGSWGELLLEREEAPLDSPHPHSNPNSCLSTSSSSFDF